MQLLLQQQESFARVGPSLRATGFMRGCSEPPWAAQLPWPKPGRHILALAKAGQRDQAVVAAGASWQREASLHGRGWWTVGCHPSWRAQIQSKMLFHKAPIPLSVLVLFAAPR